MKDKAKLTAKFSWSWNLFDLHGWVGGWTKKCREVLAKDTSEKVGNESFISYISQRLAFLVFQLDHPSFSW